MSAEVPYNPRLALAPETHLRVAQALCQELSRISTAVKTVTGHRIFAGRAGVGGPPHQELGKIEPGFRARRGAGKGSEGSFTMCNYYFLDKCPAGRYKSRIREQPGLENAPDVAGAGIPKRNARSPYGTGKCLQPWPKMRGHSCACASTGSFHHAAGREWFD